MVSQGEGPRMCGIGPRRGRTHRVAVTVVFPPLADVWAIREVADDARNQLLDKAGIPR
jgi:hypothetical protein